MRTILSVCFFSLVCIFWSREIYVPDELLRRKVKTSFRSLFCICVCGHYVLQRPLCRALRSTEQYVCIIYVFKIECSMLKSYAIKSIRCRFQMFSMLDSFFLYFSFGLFASSHLCRFSFIVLHLIWNFYYWIAFSFGYVSEIDSIPKTKLFGGKFSSRRLLLAYNFPTFLSYRKNYKVGWPFKLLFSIEQSDQSSANLLSSKQITKFSFDFFFDMSLTLLHTGYTCGFDIYILRNSAPKFRAEKDLPF